MKKAKSRYSSKRNKQSKKSPKRKINRTKLNKKKIRRRRQSGGKWASWEGASTMNNRFANFVYNRFQRVPHLSEMGDLSPYN